jgi:hypothetical protein
MKSYKSIPWALSPAPEKIDAFLVFLLSGPINAGLSPDVPAWIRALAPSVFGRVRHLDQSLRRAIRRAGRVFVNRTVAVFGADLGHY